MRNRWGPAILFLILVAGGLLLYWKHPTPKSSPHPYQEEKSAPVTASGEAATPVSSKTPALNHANETGQTASGAANSPAGEISMSDVAPAAVLENMRSTIRLYGSTFGGNPTGTNPEITSALNGNNPKQVHFIQSDSGLRINDRGELIDAWGTPFFFHQLSGTDMEIHSAGPDRKLWTSDDLVTH